MEFDSLKLKNQLCFPIYLLSKELIQKYNKILKEIDLTYTQYIVMMYFWEIHESNVKDIGRALLLDSSTLTPLLKKLENKGFVKRNRSNKDERNLHVSLTEKGKKLREKALIVPKEIGKCLSLEELDATMLYKLVYKALINVEKE